MSDPLLVEVRRPVSLWLLLFGACAAPLFWLGQVMLDYGLSAFACYPADQPVMPVSTQGLSHILLLFDGVALAAAAAGGAVSLWSLLRLRPVLPKLPGEGHARFLAIWGMLSSLWFFCAILFNAIASITVPPCVS
jgi:hypothetical protein